ncbi:uncharacterized protein [Haliotis cracherodii]|uniref:uncharacterized protein isoform X2 n=1 Tax=Haliotis cracherodii TaxID=6455 RepID=UPI0039E84F32
MKFVICVAVLALLSSDMVSGLEWLRRRESEPVSNLLLSAACSYVFEPVMHILGTPAFEDLIEDGHLSLDCSPQSLAKVDECQRSPSLRDSSYLQLKLPAAMNIFCSHKTDIEKDASCWIGRDMLTAAMSCRNSDRNVFAECAERRVGNLTGCTNTTGAIIGRMILELAD